MRVRVYRPAKSAAQSGRAKAHQWVVEPEIATPRLPDPLMGWLSAADTYSELQGRRLRFPSEKDALAFVKYKGWELVWSEAMAPLLEPRSYLSNFRTTRPEDEEFNTYPCKTTG